MTDQSSNADNSFKISRVVSAPSQRVYDAFLNPEDLAVWTPPPGFSAEVKDIEPEVGGTFQIENTGVTEETEPHSHTFVGRFQELKRGEKIVFTDESQVEHMGEEAAITVTVTFDDVPEGTEVTMVQEGIHEHVPIDQATQRWEAALETLADQVES